MRKFVTAICALILGSLLSACLDSHEEVWLNADASGTARIRISIPSAATGLYGGEEGVEKIVEDFIEATPSVTSHALETRTQNGRIHLDLAMTFSNALELINPPSSSATSGLPAAGKEMIGNTQAEFSGLNLVFKRRIELSKVIPGAILIPQSQLTDHSIISIIHLPNAASTHNADSTIDDGRALIWNTPLATALKGPVDRSFTMPLPIPWATVGVIATLLIILATAMIYYWRSRKVR